MKPNALSRQLLTEEVYGLIKQRILTHELPPGEKVNVDRLAREWDISNVSIREALSRLRSEGLIESIPFKGMFVPGLNVEELNEIYDIRTRLEIFAVELAIHRIPDDELRDVLREMDAMDIGDIAGIEERLKTVHAMNERVHGVVIRHCGNGNLQRLVWSFIERVHRYLVLTHRELDAEILQSEWEEHREILQCLARRDERAALSALQTHLECSRRRTSSLF